MLAGITALFAALVPRLEVDPRLEALLPPGTTTSQANEEAKKRFAAVSPYYLVIQSSDPELNRTLAARVLEEVQKWPETLWAIQRRDPSYFLDRRLLYVDKETLDSLAEDVEVFLEWHRCALMPGCVNFEDEPPEPDFERLRTHYETLPELASLISLFGKDNVPDPEAAANSPREGDDAGAQPPAPGSAKFGELCSKEGTVCVVQATLDGDASDLAFATKMLHRGEDLLKSLEPAAKPPDLITAVTGVYRSIPLTREAVMKDLRNTLGLTLLLIVGVLTLQFRKGRAFLLLLAPLVVGTIWSLGLFALVSPTLNLISSAVLIVLAGLGIDFSLHLITHFGSERERGLSALEAIQATLKPLMSSLWVAALTTSCGFLALSAGRFRGFAQMGLLASIGIVVILLATLLVLPPLVLLLDRRRPLTESLTRPWQPPTVLSRRWPRTPALITTCAGLLVLGVGVWQANRLDLEYDFKRLVTQAAGDHGTHYGPALHGTSRGAILMLADDAAALEEAGRGVRERYPEGLRGTEGASVITPGTFVPPDQEERLEAIARLRTLADDAARHAKGKLLHRIDAWRPLLGVTEPVRAEDMPKWVLDSFAERNGAFGRIGVVYHAYASDDARQMVELTGKLEDLRARYPRVRFASSNAVLGEVIPLLAADGVLVTSLALGGLILGTLLIGRSLRRTLLVVTAICIAVAGTVAYMVALGWKVNLYNLLVFPVAFGIGVDGAVYVVWTVYKRKGVTDWTGLPVSARAVIGATLTTMVAFGSLSISKNGGLSSLGKLAMVAFAITMVANLLWLPAALSLVPERKKTRAVPRARDTVRRAGTPVAELTSAESAPAEPSREVTELG
jgi:predicted RND superfamily exporter protein